MTVPARRRAAHSPAPARRSRLDAARARDRRGARGAPRDARHADGRRGPRRLPRGRLDRVELPRRRSRARRSGSRGTAGVDRELLAPLVRAAVENWVAARRRDALTGPIARGDEATVARQRAAVAERTPDLRRDVRHAARRHAGARGSAAMKTLRTIAEVREHVAAARRAGRSVGLVPTMGAFHAGHEALMRAAREACDEVIVSLFVNPAQFEEAADLAAYPRTEAEDAATAAGLGVDALFAPAAGRSTPRLRDGGRACAASRDVLEGAERGAGHFDGVCTVVCKLLQHRRARRRVLRPEGRPAGRRDPPHGARPRPPRPARRSCRPCASPTGSPSPRRNARLDAGDRERARRAARAAWRRSATRSRPASATPPRRGRRPRRDGRGRRGARVPRRSSTRTPSSRCARSPDGYSWSWRPASGRHG